MPSDAHVSPRSTAPNFAQFASEDFVQGAGVAIFHLASERVVICSAVDRRHGLFHFLPKGRRDAGEDTRTGAEREGYEEVCFVLFAMVTVSILTAMQSGYRNRLLPLPTFHRQPQAHPRVSAPSLTAEPIWIQMMPLGHGSKQYLLYWYIAETIPPELEKELESKSGEAYKPPPPYPSDLKLRDRLKLEPEGYEPIHHEGTGVDEEEQTYQSHLVTIGEAVQKLGKNGVMADVVLRGWKAIQDRYALEDGINSESPQQTAGSLVS